MSKRTRKIIRYLVPSSDMLYVKRIQGGLFDTTEKLSHKIFFKIGQTKAWRGDQRSMELSKNNIAELTDVLPKMLPLAHPRNMEWKLTDTRIRKQIIADNEEVESLDADLAKQLGFKDGCNEIICCPDTWTNEDFRVLVEETHAQMIDSNNAQEFTINFETTEEQNKNKNEYIVTTDIIRSSALFNYYEKLSAGSNVLFVRLFPEWYMQKLIDRGLHVYIIVDNTNAMVNLEPDKYKLIKVTAAELDRGKELMRTIENIDVKFDLVIANPPYKVGNDVIQTAMKVCKEAVVLSPVSKFKKDELFKHIRSMQSVNPDSFGADIGPCTCVALLDHEKHLDTYTDLEILQADESIREYLYENNKHEATFSYTYMVSPDEMKNVNQQVTFAMNYRACSDGVHKTTDCFDYKYNVERKINTIETTSGGNPSTSIIVFNYSVELHNFIRFWYNNPLCHQLIKKLNKTSGNIDFTLPRIDWSIDRDYEHLTLDDLINILKEENK